MAEMASMSPAINDQDHGAKVVLAGTIMLCATALMVSVAGYNRYHARTLLFRDIPLLLLGTALNIVFFALSIVMVNNGLGRHRDELTDAEADWLRRLFLGNLLVFFTSHCAVKIAYNMLARRTARSHTYSRWIDGFSGLIVAWTISNLVVVGYYLGTETEPNLYFLLVSGSISIVVVLGQLFAFLLIIWRTAARLKQKLSWSACMTVFVPLCIAAIVVRLVYTPESLFTGDWTFDNTAFAVLLLIDLNMVIITVLAPNLPMFFNKASTGTLFFMPTSTTRSESVDSYQLTKGSGSRATHMDRAYNGTTLQTTVESTVEQDRTRSFASDVILLQRSVEVTNGAPSMRKGSSQQARVHSTV